MRADLTVFLPLLASADAYAITARGDESFHPKTKTPHFFNLEVNDRCDRWAHPAETKSWQCPLEGYAIRLEKGIAVATPYDKWWDPKLATFFVDDDTQLYTVSKDPLQLYIDAVTGAVKYTKVGWLPPSAISTSFYHTGNNPLQLVDPSPSYLTWPSTMGIAFKGYWAFCPLGETGQYQLFVNNRNFDPQGVRKDKCKYKALAAVNANPWKKVPSPPPYGSGSPQEHHDEPEKYSTYSVSEADADGADSADFNAESVYEPTEEPTEELIDVSPEESTEDADDGTEGEDIVE